MPVTREQYRPTEESNFLPFESKEVELPKGTEIYIDNYRYSLIAFSGRRQKPDIYRRYANQDQVNCAVKKYLNELIQKHDKKASDRNWQHNVKVGDIFRCSWGYDQTNIDYFEVIEKLGKSMVRIVEIKRSSNHDGDYYSGKCVPLKGEHIPNTETRVKVSRLNNDKPYIKVFSGIYTAFRVDPIKSENGVETYPASYWSNGR